MLSDILIDQNAIIQTKKFKLNDDCGFGRIMAPLMITIHYKDGEWKKPKLIPYAPLMIDPAAKVLHYAQEIFEGLKAYKNDKEEVFLFRPEMNAKRFNASARRLSMPELPIDIFINSCKLITSIAHHIVPTKSGSSLYLRPFMIGTEATLGVKPADEYMYVLIASPAASYFKNPNVKVLVEDEACRASKGGIGFAKTGGNYAASLMSFEKLAKNNCDQTLWLDANETRYIEELSGMNFFAVINGELHTPQLSDTILPGITRNSILQLATEFKITTVERKIDINELIQDIRDGRCTEAFACGTASVLTPICSINYKREEYKLSFPEGKIAKEIKQELLNIQTGRCDNRPDWRVFVPEYNS